MACATATPDFRFTGPVTVKFFHLGGSNDPPSAILASLVAPQFLADEPNASDISDRVCSA